MTCTSINSAIALMLVAAPIVWAQSSSLYVNQPRQTNAAPPSSQAQSARASGQSPRHANNRSRSPMPRQPRANTARGEQKAPHQLSPAIRANSIAAVGVPQPRSFAVNDLVTIIIRESTETDFQATLETEKSSEHSAEIAEFPRLTLADLANLQLRPNDFEDGNPQLDVTAESEFEGEGDYQRSEEMSGRITARVADVKPNGTLAVEARKFVKSDGESLNITLTGLCRAEDITADNTVLSSEIYNLHLNKTHEGELKTSTEKGVLTKILDSIFNF